MNTTSSPTAADGSQRRAARAPIVALVALLGLASSAHAENFGQRTVSLFGPTVEFTLTVPGLADAERAAGRSPFDLVGHAVFTHVITGEQRRTEFFLLEDDTWAVRFAPTRVGRWNLQTFAAPVADCPDCRPETAFGGHTGFVTVADDPSARGFTVSAGRRWARQLGEGGLEPFTPQYVMAPADLEPFTDPAEIDELLDTFIDEHAFTGLHFEPIAGRWFQLDSPTPNQGLVVDFAVTGSDPDPRTFEVLESIVNATHARGAAVHFWEWGDTQRDWTLDNDGEGENGVEHRRLLRYIAARLGPVPGWSIGYGFDLNEWTTPEIMSERTDYLDARLGWPHLLGGRSPGPNFGGDHSDDVPWHVPQEYAGYEHHEPPYEVLVAATLAGADEQLEQAVMSEDRFRVRGFNGSGKDYTLDQTAEGLWLSMLAGGVSSIWGNLTQPDGTIVSGLEGSLPYGNVERLHTFGTFFADPDRLPLDAVRANELVAYSAAAAADDQYATPGQYAIRGIQTPVVVAYAQDTDSVTLDLASLAGDPAWAGGARVIAVDADAEYAEIDLGTIPLVDQELDLSAFGGPRNWALELRPLVDCPGDANASGIIDVFDLFAVLSNWGPCSGSCPGDVDADGVVDSNDLLVVIASWGPCPG